MRTQGSITTNANILHEAVATILFTTYAGGYGSPCPVRNCALGGDDVLRERGPHNSRAFENANELTRRVFSSKISVRVIGGSARWLQFSRSQSRQLTPIGVPSAFSRSIPAAYTSFAAWRISQPRPIAKRGCGCGCGATGRRTICAI